MSESTSEDFSDSDTDVKQDEEPKAVEKITEENKNEEDSDDKNLETDSSDDEDDEEVEQAPKKRKTLQDYLIEKVN